ncbi:RpiB/LacA/LacB family sugar-phosphate isomerase [Desulfococcaceae bacterium HSG8]|nr:RpiB/LacA/LacB family sugar-phosphate isomerase [Desulfococcaceae bacterium HSG8]
MKRTIMGVVLLFAFCLTVPAYSGSDQKDAAKMKVAVGSAFYGQGELKKTLIGRLREKGCEVRDFTEGDPAKKLDYPGIADQVAAEVSKGNYDRGILICGTGMGMSIVANKHPRVYAALVEDEYAARYSRIFNNSNVLCLGQFVTAPEKAADILDTWLDAKFADHPKWGKYCRETALPQIAEIEKKVFK